MNVLVTGGSGFIGSALIRRILRTTDWQVTNFDALTYAPNPMALAVAEQSKNYSFIRGDIRKGLDLDQVCPRALLSPKHFDLCFHLAAESDVTRSLQDPGEALDTNANGVFQILTALSAYVRRFVFVSTDEVYGSLPFDAAPLTEFAPLAPSTPYACGKAMGDLLVHTWCKTHGIDAVITRCTNNYGPFQHHEKLVPRMVAKCVAREPLTIHGAGTQIRDWIHVEDHVSALLQVAEKGEKGQVYHVGANQEIPNVQVIEAIGRLMSFEEYARIPDRVANDTRYALDASKLRSLGWTPQYDFWASLPDVVAHYRDSLRASSI